MSIKKLHSFTVNLEQEVEKVETRQENGQEITTKSKVKELVPIEIIMKEPTRKERQELSLFYGVSYNEALNKNLSPKILLVQKFIKDPNSPLSEGEDKNLGFLLQKRDKLENDLMKAKTLAESPENEKLITDIITDFITTQRKIVDIETSYRSLFAHTAETYAQNKSVTWLILFLSYYVKNGQTVPFFSGNSFEEKENHLFDLEEKQDTLYFKAVDKLSAFFGLYALGQANNPKEFAEWEEKIKKESEVSEKEKTEAPAES